MPSLVEEIIRNWLIDSWKGIILLLTLTFLFLTRGAWCVFITSIKKVKKGDFNIDLEHPWPIEPRDTVATCKTEEKTIGTLVTYKIAQHFPELKTIPFDFLKDWKVWFLIKNHEMNKYKAYITIKFITSDDYEENAGGHYGGTIAWRLNELSVIVAPGLGIPEKIQERVKQGKGIKVSILGEIRDENDNFIEKKLPVEYIYNPKNNSWYYEP